MRIIRFILDLPWWSGLPIFLVGSSIVPHWGIFGYMIGIFICLFGCWVFSKLLDSKNEYKDIETASFSLFLFFLIMSIPYKFDFLTVWLSFLNTISPTFLYAIRSGFGLWFGFLAFTKGFRK